jgi:quercetin dioxygenase-like cupin family protein
MQLRKYRWSRDYESAEEELIQLLARKSIAAERWVGEPSEAFESHSHPFDKRLWCAEGSIVVYVDDKAITLQSGDALDLPASTVHHALVGFSGCAMYESHTTPEPISR